MIKVYSIFKSNVNIDFLSGDSQSLLPCSATGNIHSFLGFGAQLALSYPPPPYSNPKSFPERVGRLVEKDSGWWVGGVSCVAWPTLVIFALFARWGLRCPPGEPSARRHGPPLCALKPPTNLSLDGRPVNDIEGVSPPRAKPRAAGS